MATFTPTVPARGPATSRGNRNNPPSIPGGGDDSRPDFGAPDHSVRLRRARLGLLVALTPILMLFVSFTSAYVFRQGLPSFDPGTNTVVHDWLPIPLPNTLFLINTMVLLASSVTVELARRKLAARVTLAPVGSIPGVSLGDEKEFPWLGVTIILGIGFLVGQFFAWRDLAARGFFVASGPSSSFVYLLTGVHAIHLLGGVLALLVAGTTVILRRSVESRHIVVDVTAWYWHFMALLWIYILSLMEFAH
jgi:cytochrome c oxidase subunit III